MKKVALKDIAPAKAARVSHSSNDFVWQLNLDQIEAQSGRVLSKVTGLASTAGSSTQAFDTGNVLYSKLRPYLNKVVCPDSPGIATTELVPLRPDPKQLDRLYLTYYLRSPEFVTWISNEVAGAKMPRVTMKVFWEHQIPLPPLAEQQRIAAILDAADALRAKRREALAQLDALLQSSFLTLFGDPVTNPMGWEIKRLGESFSKTRSGTCCGPFGSALKKHEYVSEGIPVWGIDNVQLNAFTEKGCLFITSEKYSQLARYSVERGDILISRAGTVGRMCEANPTMSDSIIGSNLIRLALDPSSMLPIFFTCLYTFCGTRLPGLKASGDEKSYSFLNTTKLQSLRIPRPPIDLQQKFAAIVESIERQKTAQRHHLAELDALFSSLQHRAFRGEL